MRRRIPQSLGEGRWGGKTVKVDIFGEERGAAYLLPEHEPWGRRRSPGRFYDRGQVHYFLAELHHWGGSKTLEKRLLHETPTWVEPPTEFPVSNEVWEEQKDSCASRRAQMQQRDLKGTQGWNGLDSTCVDHQLLTTGNAHLLAQWHWH